MKKTGKMTINPFFVVINARDHGWSAELLAQCFHDMSTETAQDLLDFKCNMYDSGEVRYPEIAEQKQGCRCSGFEFCTSEHNCIRHPST